MHKYKRVLCQYAKVSIIWIVLFFLLFEFVLAKLYLHHLPLKFYTHLSGPVQRLSQYTKENLMPKDYIAISGDSYADGFGPWLYDNSWSWGQPSYATQHLIHERTGIDCITYSYPGYGNFGTAISMVAEHDFFEESTFWLTPEDPKLILFFFYEGNDLLNNIHETRQRGISTDFKNNKKSLGSFRDIMTNETKMKMNDYGWMDNFSTINLFNGLFLHYFSQIEDPAISSEIPANRMPNNHFHEKNSTKRVIDKDNVENLALINNQVIPLGFAEGPALHLSEKEIMQSLLITEESISYVKQNYEKSRIAIIYIPSALALYEFESEFIRPAPFTLDRSTRDKTFEPQKARDKSDFLRKHMKGIAQRQNVYYIDPVDKLREIAQKELLHGPRDPIHFNEKGYKAFADSIIPKTIKVYNLKTH